MNNELVTNFIKAAQASGLSKEQAENYLKATFSESVKTAEQAISDFSDAMISECGIVKSATVKSYVEGFVKSASDRNLPVESIKQFTKTAIALVKKEYPEIFKSVQVQKNEKVASYIDGFLTSAGRKGFSKEQAVNLLIKRAEADTSGLGAQILSELGQGGQSNGIDLQSLLAGLSGQQAAPQLQQNMQSMPNIDLFKQLLAQ